MPNYGDLVQKVIPAEYMNAVSENPVYYNRAAVMVARRLCNDLFWGGETDLSAIHAASMLSMLPLEVLNGIADNSKTGLTWKILSWARMASTHDTMLPELEYTVAKKYGFACGIRLVHLATKGCLELYPVEERERKNAEGMGITTIFPRVLQDYGLNREESGSFVRNFIRTFNGTRRYDQTFMYVNEAQTHMVPQTLLRAEPAYPLSAELLGSPSVRPIITTTGRIYAHNTVQIVRPDTVEWTTGFVADSNGTNSSEEAPAERIDNYTIGVRRDNAGRLMSTDADGNAVFVQINSSPRVVDGME